MSDNPWAAYEKMTETERERNARDLSDVLKGSCSVPRAECSSRGLSNTALSLERAGCLELVAYYGVYIITETGRKLLGWPSLVAPAEPATSGMPEVHKAIATAAMDDDRKALRRAVTRLHALDGDLFRSVNEPYVLRENVEPLLLLGAWPDSECYRAAIMHRHCSALISLCAARQYRDLNDSEQQAIMDWAAAVLGIARGTDVLGILLDWGMRPSPGLAQAAAKAGNADAIKLLRGHGLTEEELIQGVCSRGQAAE